MKRKSIPALFLVLCLLLAACGSEKIDSGPEQPSNLAAYTSTPVPLDLSEAEVTASGAGNGSLYLACREEEELDPAETEGDGSGEISAGGFTFSASDDDDGGFTISSGMAGHAVLYRVDLTNGTVTKLDGYVPGEGMTAAAVVPCGDGSLWVLEQAESFDSIDFDLGGIASAAGAAGFDDLGGGSGKVWRKLDASGTEELDRIDVTELHQNLGVEAVDATLMDREGRLYAASGTALAVLDSKLSVLFTCKCQETIDQLVTLGDGSVGAVTSGESGRSVYAVDFEQQALGGACPVTGSGKKIFTGNENYNFLYNNGDSLYGWPKDASAPEKILSWSGAGVDMGQITALALLPDGTGTVISRGQAVWPVSYSAFALEPAGGEELAGRTVLTLATLGLDSETRAKVLEFNRTSGSCRIEVRDYSEFNTAGDPSAGLTKLHTEILAGNLPDLLEVSDGIPLRNYASKGLLEDLWPYIESDGALGRENVMERVLQADEISGKLYRVFPRFWIETAAGNPDAVGNSAGWDLDGLRAAMEKLGPGCSVLGKNETKNSVLEDMFSNSLDHFIDWDAGTANFDSPEFRAILEFCDTFPAKPQNQNDPSGAEESPYTWAARGEQMLLPVSLGDLSSIQIYRALFGENAAFVGYPGEGGSGASFRVEGGLAMLSSCGDKDGAWDFMRQMLLADGDRFTPGFPVNRANFEKTAEESMKITYARDENGDPIIGSDGEPILEGTSYVLLDTQMVMLKPPAQEDYDLVMSLYERAGTVSGRDENIWAIVQEGAGAYFAGDRTVEDAAKSIRNRAELYLNEQK